MDLDYDSCAQFLARLDADLNTNTNNDNNNNNNNNNHHTLSSSASPVSILDTSLSLDNRNPSSSPPGLSSGSATSHSPESLRFDYDVGSWNSSDPVFFSPIDDPAGILAAQSWDALMPQAGSSRQQQQQAGRVVSPLTEYIKIEDGSSPGSYFNNQQATISPSNSLLDPTTQTALEGTYSFGKDSDSLFDFNTYGAVGAQSQGNGNGDAYSGLAWRNPEQQREDFGAIGWQSPGPQAQQQQQQVQQQQQQQQQRQQLPQRQQRISQSQERSPLIHSLSPASSTHSHRTTSSPDSRAHDSHSDDNSIPRPKKRKTSTDEGGEDNAALATTSSGRKQQPKKTAHNMIEKRYRTNLNDKIAALRDSVPSLRVMAGTSKLGDDGEDDEDLEGLTPAHKLNKATVLAKATEYIRHLEKRTKRLQDENDQLKNRLDAFEKLANMGSMNNIQQGGGQRGAGGGPGGGLMSRLMVGSLAGLMVVNGLQENESGSRQLFAIPGLDIFGISELGGNQMFWLFIKMMLLFSAVAYVLIPGFFDSKSEKSKNGAPENACLSPVPSLASSIEIRRTAWLTAVQSVWVPRNSLIMELAALGFKALKLSLRKLVGWRGYAILTGMTEEHELARIKAWTIAIDAQLAGGDAMVTQSRLLLTLLASMTIPATPGRLMLNALHIKVLFWNLGIHFESFADRLANYYWSEARKAQLSADSTEALPEHLTQLLELDPSDVMDIKIVQKAYNLAYDRKTNANCEAHDQGMDTVVEDQSIRSPLDALAAWYSSLIVQSVLATSLKVEKYHRHISDDLQVALKVAPPGSKAQLRTLIAKAILDTNKEGTDLRMALLGFEEDMKIQDKLSTSVFCISLNTPSAATTTTDIHIAIRCAMALNLLSNGSRVGATRLFSDFDWRRQPSDIGLLGFVSIWKTLNAFVEGDEGWVKEAGESVDSVAAVLRIWIGDRKMRRGSRKIWVGKSDANRVIDFCNGLQKKLAGLVEESGSDDGYVSGVAVKTKARRE